MLRLTTWTLYIICLLYITLYADSSWKPSVGHWVPQLNLTKDHRIAIECGHELDDLHMDAVSQLLQESCGHINGLHKPLSIAMPQLLRRKEGGTKVSNACIGGFHL